MFDRLSEQLHAAIKGLRGHGHISDINIASALKEIRRALVAADVNYKLAKEVTEKIKIRALGEKVRLSVSPGKYFTKLTADALAELMGSTKHGLSLQNKPSVMLITGLQGSGKTTFCAKLALHLKKQGQNVALVACDVHRPAAIEQLQILGERISVPVHALEDNKDPLKVAERGIATAKEAGSSTIVIDTAGRLAVDAEMMEELRALKVTTQPEETLFVLDAMMGQDAVQTAKTFQEAVGFDGVVLSKLDGDTRGGAALSVRSVTERPIKFTSQGEDLSTLDVFHPDRMAQRILGMGDVLSLVEKAQEQFDEKEQRKLIKKLRKSTFDLDDFLSQLQQVRKMGNLKELVGMMPGMSKHIGQITEDESALKRPEHIIQSMTPYERKNPHLIKQSRKLRIAKGSGNDISAVNMLLKRYDMVRKMMKKASTGSLNDLQAQLKQ